MMRIALLSALMLFVSGMTSAQQWSVVWKLNAPPYLTKTDITDMDIVKAGFDTDKDGKGEFLCAWDIADTNALLMYEADGNNNYRLVWSWLLPTNANSFAGIAVGDINNNGVVDIVVTMPVIADATNPRPMRVWAFEWNGVVGQHAYGFFNSSTGTYDPSSGWDYGVTDNYDLRPYSLTIEDIDKDGVNELITGVRVATGNAREIYVSSVDGDFGGFAVWNLEWKYSQTFGGANYSTTTGDLDNDGKREIYMFVWNFFTMRIFECTGDKQFTQVFAVDTLYYSRGIDYGAVDAVRVMDVNKDGVNEMYIAGTENKNKIFIVTGVTDVSKMTSADIKELYTLPVTALGGLKSMYAADPDHDGYQELLIGGERNGQIFELDYKGTGNPADSSNWQHKILFDMFKESGVPTLKPRMFYGCPAGDMDKDGKDEYVFVNYSPNYSVWADDAPLWVIEANSATSVRTEPVEVPDNMQLLQNFPNPFNPSTTIPFRLSSRSHVQLDVFDVYGQHIASLMDAEREPGYHQARWKANVPSGTYFYRLLAEPLDGSGKQFKEIKKMLLVR